MIKMIEFYYQCKLSQNEINMIPTKEHKILPASMKKYMETYNKKDLFKFLNNKNK